MVGGSFTQLDGVSMAALGRLNADGSLDTTFQPANLGSLLEGVVYSIALQPDGKILVGGRYTTNNLSNVSVPGAGFTRLNADGSPDATFNNAFAGSLALTANQGVTVKAIVVQPEDGSILVAGSFLM